MLTLLSALVPSAAALIVGCWVLIEQLGRMRERRVRVKLQPERERLTAKYREEALLNPPVDYDGVNARANHDYQQLLERAGVSARRAGRTSAFTDFNVEMEMGPTLPGAEVARQAILLGGATAGVVLLAIAELTKGV